jgi:sporulation protein YlmC with PRC-barrel domain
MLVYGKCMKRIGKVTDIEFDLKERMIKQLVVKVDYEEAKKAWKRRLQIRSPKILSPAELVSGAKDAILLQRTLEEMENSVKKAQVYPNGLSREEPLETLV